jgi:hypothetical protein
MAATTRSQLNTIKKILNIRETRAQFAAFLHKDQLQTANIRSLKAEQSLKSIKNALVKTSLAAGRICLQNEVKKLKITHKELKALEKDELKLKNIAAKSEKAVNILKLKKRQVEKLANKLEKKAEQNQEYAIQEHFAVREIIQKNEAAELAPPQAHPLHEEAALNRTPAVLIAGTLESRQEVQLFVTTPTSKLVKVQCLKGAAFIAAKQRSIRDQLLQKGFDDISFSDGEI